MFWKKFFLVFIAFSGATCSLIPFLRENLTSIQSWNKLYRILLHDGQHHTLTDTVSSPIDLSKIRSKNFDEDYLENTCFETATDLLRAHGHNVENVSLTNENVENLLPALLLTIVNSGCEPEGHGLSYQPILRIWLQGLLLLVLIKMFHSITFCLSHSCVCRQSKSKSPVEKNSSRIRYHWWTNLALNGFTCGLMLGIITYHLIPQIDQVTNEGFDYEYLYRGTALLGGIFLFLMVEKILRLRLNIHKIQSVDSHIPLKDLGAQGHVDCSADGPRPLLSITSNDDQRRSPLNNEKREKLWIRSYLIYDLSYDFIYGCGLSTTFAYDRFTGFVLSLMIFSEGFRRYSPRLATLGRVYGFYSLFLSITFLIFGYLIGGIIVDLDEQFNIRIEYLRKEYLYSILYGAIFYTTLVTLITELNDLGNHLISTSKGFYRSNIKARIFFCQFFFLLFGILITLILAVRWRFDHRLMIFDHVCRRDPSRSFCFQSL